MPITMLTRAAGAALIVIGVAGYVLTDFASATALLPAVLGLVILVCGLLAAQERRHRAAVHVALAVALLGLLGSLPRVVGGGGAGIASALTVLICAVYLAVGVRSFVAARTGGAAR